MLELQYPEDGPGHQDKQTEARNRRSPSASFLNRRLPSKSTEDLTSVVNPPIRDKRPSLQQLNPAPTRPESGLGYYSLSNTPSPTASEVCSASWNAANGSFSLFSMSSASTSGLASSISSAAGQAGTPVNRDCKKCSKMSAGFYCSKHRGGDNKKLGSSVGSYLSTINLGDSFSFGGQPPTPGAHGKRSCDSGGSSRAPYSPSLEDDARNARSPISAQLGPPRVRKNPFFKTMHASNGRNRRAVEDILNDTPEVRSHTSLLKYKALPAIGSSSKHFQQYEKTQHVPLVCDSTRAGSPIDDTMPFPADIRSFGTYHEKQIQHAPQADMFLHVESNLVPEFSELADGMKPSLARRRTFEIIEPIDDDLERPVVDECVVYSESEDDDEEAFIVNSVQFDRNSTRDSEDDDGTGCVEMDDLEFGPTLEADKQSTPEDKSFHELLPS